MDADLRPFLNELYEFGRRNDEAKSDRSERMLNITPETGEFLRMLVIGGKLRHVLELGAELLQHRRRDLVRRAVTAIVDGGNHYYAGREIEAVRLVADWLAKNL